MRLVTLGPFQGTSLGNGADIVSVRLADYLTLFSDDDDFAIGVFLRAASVSGLSLTFRAALDATNNSRGTVIGNTIAGLGTTTSVPFYGTLARPISWLVLRTGAAGVSFTNLYMDLVI